MARLESDAAGIAGKPFNLASPSQLADVLYTVLKVWRAVEWSVEGLVSVEGQRVVQQEPPALRIMPGCKAIMGVFAGWLNLPALPLPAPAAAARRSRARRR